MVPAAYMLARLAYTFGISPWILIGALFGVAGAFFSLFYTFWVEEAGIPMPMLLGATLVGIPFFVAPSRQAHSCTWFVWRPGDTQPSVILGVGDMLAGDPVVPGFSYPVADLFR